MALLFLALLNSAAHFLPPERMALAPDDLFYLFRLRGTTLADLPRLVAENPTRPLNEVFLVLQTWIVDGNPALGLLLLWLSTTLLLFACHFFFATALRDRRAALLCSAVFCLLPHKLESYHTPIFVNVNVACALYMASACLFLKAVQRSRPSLMAASALLYALGIFWYEVGFFLPLACWAWSRMEGRRIPWRRAWLFSGIVVSSYLVYRFLQAGPTQGGRPLGLNPRPLVDLLHHYVGAFFALSVANGLYNFFRMDIPWLLVAVLAAAAAVRVLCRVASPATPVCLDAGRAAPGAAWFALFVLPLSCRGQGVWRAGI